MQFEPLSRVVHRAVLNAPSGLKASQIAEQVGRPYRVMIAELLHDGTRKPDMDLLVPYLHATGSDEPLKHLARVTGTVFLRLPEAESGMEPITQEMADSVKRFGERLSVLGKSIEDGVITPREALAINKEGHEVIAAVLRVLKRTEAAADY